MNYIEGIASEPYDLQGSHDEAMAQRQQALDVLYAVGCEFNVSDEMMQQLCRIACVNFADLQNYNGVPA